MNLVEDVANDKLEGYKSRNEVDCGVADAIKRKEKKTEARTGARRPNQLEWDGKKRKKKEEKEKKKRPGFNSTWKKKEINCLIVD